MAWRKPPDGQGVIATTGDIWQYAGQAVLAITTNGSLTCSGLAVPGNGVAKQAADRYPWLRAELGGLLRKYGNHVFDLGCGIVSFPVEETAWSQPDPEIISRSAAELRAMADGAGWQRIIVPRPGCGGGGLRWSDVHPLLVPWFDDRFLLISQK